jgi:hypothetical protein
MSGWPPQIRSVPPGLRQGTPAKGKAPRERGKSLDLSVHENPPLHRSFFSCFLLFCIVYMRLFYTADMALSIRNSFKRITTSQRQALQPRALTLQ